MASCRSCSASIFWAVTKKPNGDVSARMPVDVEATPDGNLEIVDSTRTPDEENWTPVVRVLKKGEGDTLPGMPVPDRYKSHFATCPNAASHRRRT